MELSESVLDGLRLAGSSLLDDKQFDEVVSSAVQGLGNPAEYQEDTSKSAPAKEALYGITSLLVELSRADADEASLCALLEDCKFTSDRIKLLTTKYLKHKSEFRSSLGRICSSPPHLADVQWRLDYYLKNNYVEKVNHPEYLINFTTQNQSEKSDSNVTFACTQEQLEGLVLKLKDATKTLEKYTQH